MAVSPPAPPADSATVILLREPTPDACEVLLVERHAESRAFAGAHVFPGGRVDLEDSASPIQAASAHVTPIVAAARLGEDLLPPMALAFWIAAIRELFEETGVLLASQDGATLSFTDSDRGERFRAHRTALLTGQLTFGELVARERLLLATDQLEYFSRWITPVNAPRRYDARFFVASSPPGQQPLHDRRETTAAAWFTPADALARAREGALLLTPPTMRTLEDLRDLGSPERIVRAARNRIFSPILPKVVQIAGGMAILYPGDAEYEDAVPGEPTRGDVPGPRNRVVMEAGAWRSIRSNS